MQTAYDSDGSHVGRPNGNGEKRKRRHRLQLSCGECRKKKLSCDRELPCQRCLRSGKPQLCVYESSTANPPAAGASSQQRHTQRSNGEIKDLRAEINRLKAELSKQNTQVNNTNDSDSGNASGLNANGNTQQEHPIKKFPTGYYTNHAIFRFFIEIPKFLPFTKEIVDELLIPHGVRLSKVKPSKNDAKTSPLPDEQHGLLEELLPPKEDLDVLVDYYLDNFAHIHHVIHVPSFRRKYTSFWNPEKARHPAMIALVMAMISISVWPSGACCEPTSSVSRYQTSPQIWISACDRWLGEQSLKHRKLVHYQIACLTYQAKRLNLIRKKKWWADTGSLVQNAIMDRLHRGPSDMAESAFTKEMKRRLWAAIRELDLQNALEHCLPTLLHNIDSDIGAPANVDDTQFDEESEEIPQSKPVTQYTCSSYQFLSAKSWSLRLEICRRLLNSGSPQRLDYEEVLHFTHRLSQAMHAIPKWVQESMTTDHNMSEATLSYAFLQFQLKECMVAIHRPYLHRDDSQYWMSENICYQMAREGLLLNVQLADLGIQPLAFLREDLGLLTMTMSRIGQLQPKDSTGIFFGSYESTVDLLEQCAKLVDQRYLRCCTGEPWFVMIMCMAVMLLKFHFEKETWQTAKQKGGQKILELYHQRYGSPGRSGMNSHQDMMPSGPHSPMRDVSVSAIPKLRNNRQQANRRNSQSMQMYAIDAGGQQVVTPNLTTTYTPDWLESNCIDLGLDAFNNDTDTYGMWDAWNMAWPTQLVG